MEHVGEAFLRNMMHPLSCRFGLQRVGQVVQGLRSLQEVFAAYGLPFEGIAAVVPGRFPLDSLSNLRYRL